MQTFEQIRQQVGQWSRENFGGQETPYLRALAQGNIRPGEKRGEFNTLPGFPLRTPTVVALEGLAPLMGVVEEVGELFGATTQKDKADALSDVAIYLCDYLSREGMAWPVLDEVELGSLALPPFNGMVASLGELYHCHLKRLQRIREMHVDENFKDKRAMAVCKLVLYLKAAAREATGSDLLTLLNETWNNIVKKRNWKKDADKGGNHAHDNPTPTDTSTVEVGARRVPAADGIGATRVPVTPAQNLAGN